MKEAYELISDPITYLVGNMIQFLLGSAQNDYVHASAG